MKECNQCAKRDCKVMYSKFPTFRHKHKLDAAILSMSCKELGFGYQPFKPFHPRLNNGKDLNPKTNQEKKAS